MCGYALCIHAQLPDLELYAVAFIGDGRLFAFLLFAKETAQMTGFWRLPPFVGP